MQGRWLPGSGGLGIGTLAFAEGNEPLPQRSAVRFANGALSGTKPRRHRRAQCRLRRGAGRRARAARCSPWPSWTAHGAKPIDSFDNSRGYADLVFAATPAALIAQGDPGLGHRPRGAVPAWRSSRAHEQLGGAEALMLMARDYALERKAFGQPIGAFQSVKHRIAELYTLVELARANCIHAASREGAAGLPQGRRRRAALRDRSL